MDVINTKYDKDNYDPQEYLKAWLSPQPPLPLIRFVCKTYHQFWQGIQEKDLTYLEFGGGPSIYPLVSATPHLKHIVFSDINEDNRKAIEAWQRNEGTFDWGPNIKYIVQELEGKEEDEVSKREDEIREKIRAVVHCDIHNEDIVEKRDLPKEFQPPYDVVSLSFCLGVCIYTDDEYKGAIRKLTNLLKPGGYLVMADATGESFYIFGNKKYYCFDGLTRELAMEAMESAGLQEINFTSVPAMLNPEVSDAKEVFVVTGRLPHQ